MRRAIRTGLILLAACVLYGCAEGEVQDRSAPPAADESQGERPFQTDRDRYAATVDAGQGTVTFEVPMRFTNVTADTVFLRGCHRPSAPLLERLEDETWTAAYAAVELQCLSPPWAIGPEETFRDTLFVNGSTDEQYPPTFGAEVEGTYRLVRNIYTSREGGATVADSLQTSNTFTVVPE